MRRSRGVPTAWSKVAMGSTTGSSIGFPSSALGGSRTRRIAARFAGVAAIVIAAFAVLIAVGVAGVDTGAYGLPAIALAAAALVLSIVLVRRRRSPLALLVAFASVPVVLAAILAGAAIGDAFACSGGERHALRQIAHLGGVHPGIAGYLQGSGCIVRYTTHADPTTVAPHYEQSLTRTGWLLTAIQPYGRDRASGDLYATRGALSIWVSWFPAAGSSTRVIVSLHD